MKYVGSIEIEGFEELADDASILGDDCPLDVHDVASRETRS
jgi:hypothetical protein